MSISKQNNKKHSVVVRDSEKIKDKITRRDFLTLTATAVAAVGAGCALWPMINSLEPASDILALSSIDVDISDIAKGQTLVVKWRGKPVFITHRTEKQIKEAENVNLNQLVDPQKDSDRVKAGHSEWLVTIGICTHLGCIPLPNQGNYDGWLCPCHGSDYDSSGRIRSGPAPSNLAIPPYQFISDTKIRIG